MRAGPVSSEEANGREPVVMEPDSREASTAENCFEVLIYHCISREHFYSKGYPAIKLSTLTSFTLVASYYFLADPDSEL